MKYFEDLTKGEVITFGYRYHVTEEEILEFAERWDPQPFHVDKEVAEKSMFKGLVASSIHIFAMWSSIGMRDGKNPLAAVSILGYNNIKITAPVRPGDTLHTRLIIESLRDSKSKPGLGIVELSGELYNQSEEKVFSVTEAFLIKRRENS